MYKNIGEKIKGLARGTFIVEAIGSVIMGFLFDWDGLNFLICLIGPIVAYVSTWLIYGFGELIVETCQNRETNQEILTFLKQNKNHDKVDNNSQSQTHSENTLLHRWNNGLKAQGEKTGKCDLCGARRQTLLFAEFEDIFGKSQRNMCYECFEKHEGRPLKTRDMSD